MILVLSSVSSQISYTFFLTYFFVCGLIYLGGGFMAIGKRIKEARLEKAMTQEELAKLVGVTKGAIANYENNVSHPKEPVMYALINALGVDANFLFQDFVTIKEPFVIEKEMENLVKKYRSLDDHGKEAVDAILDVEHRRCQREKPHSLKLDIKAEVASYQAELELQEKAEEKSSASDGSGGTEKMA